MNGIPSISYKAVSKVKYAKRKNARLAYKEINNKDNLKRRASSPLSEILKAQDKLFQPIKIEDIQAPEDKENKNKENKNQDNKK